LGFWYPSILLYKTTSTGTCLRYRQDVADIAHWLLRYRWAGLLWNRAEEWRKRARLRYRFSLLKCGNLLGWLTATPVGINVRTWRWRDILFYDRMDRSLQITARAQGFPSSILNPLLRNSFFVLELNG
jgi:hypothetical protein